MVAKLIHIGNTGMQGTVEVILPKADNSPNDSSQIYTLINNFIKPDISLKGEENPVKLFIYGKVGSAFKDGLLVLVYYDTKDKTVCISLAHDRGPRTRVPIHVEDGAPLLLNVSDTDGTCKIIIYKNTLNKVVGDYDLAKYINVP